LILFLALYNYPEPRNHRLKVQKMIPEVSASFWLHPWNLQRLELSHVFVACPCSDTDNF
jgi:hypothetical protein